MINKKNKEKSIIKEKRIKIIKNLIFDIFIFILFLVLSILLFQKSLIFESVQNVKYFEKSNLDYKVYLHENEFYEQEYLNKDMLYIASLIDKILIDFDYTFESEDNENIDFDYKIVATLTIQNQAGTRSYFEKTFTLLNNRTINLKNSNRENIKETVNLNYQYYNSLANSFKNQYGVDADSKLTVYMLVNKKSNENSNFSLDDTSTMNLVIPLSERSVEIRMDYKDINQTNNIVKKKEHTITDYIPILIAIISIIISLIWLVMAIRKIESLHIKKSEYDKYISKLLKEYDRLVAESSTLLSFEGKEIISITKFSELLDIHDNLQLPIMYYEVSKHKECYFYISHENMVYLLKVDEKNLNNMK